MSTVVNGQSGSVVRVLAIEPFFAGSHRQFLEQWAARSRHRFDLLTFEGRHWKWRMRHSAVSAAREIQARVAAGNQWDVIFASSMLPLAELKGLCPEAARLPSVLYFHENQLTYPVREERERDDHFAYSNFVSTCAADAVWFNSRFHRDDWFAALPSFLRRFPDHGEVDLLPELQQKSQVETPGVEPPIAMRSTGHLSGPFQITWAARWEHDKNPEDFFAALELLQSANPDLGWQVNVLGQRFGQQPECFDSAREWLGPRVNQWGELSREQYLATLANTDVFVSTAQHEFFGIAAVEAMAAGAYPLLPERLSYPELVGVEGEALYDGTVAELAGRLEALMSASDGRLACTQRQQWSRFAERYLWGSRSGELDKALERIRP